MNLRSLLILLIICSGCGSHKSAVKKNERINKIENVDLTVKETKSRNSYEDVIKYLNSSVIDYSTIRSTETEYSKPDSLGNQYKLNEKVTEVMNDITVYNTENEHVIRKQKYEIEQQTKLINELQTKLELKTNKKTSTKTRTPIWIYIAIYIVGIITIPIFKLWIKKH